MKIGKEIALEAKRKGICKEWYNMLMNVTQHSQLANIYFRGDDWAMEYDFPSVELLKKYAGVAAYGLITDGSGKYVNKHRLAFFGNSDVELEYNGYGVGNIIVRHNSQAKIRVKDEAVLFVNLLDNATVQIECTEDAKVIVYAYGNLENVIAKGNVQIKKSSWQR